jgi:hypothetical protein
MNKEPVLTPPLHSALQASAAAALCAIALGCAAMTINGSGFGYQCAGLLFASFLFFWRGGAIASVSIGEDVFYAIASLAYLILIGFATSSYAVTPIHLRFIVPFTIVAVVVLYAATAAAVFIEEIYYVFLWVNHGWSLKPREKKRHKR